MFCIFVIFHLWDFLIHLRYFWALSCYSIVSHAFNPFSREWLTSLAFAALMIYIILCKSWHKRTLITWSTGQQSFLIWDLRRLLLLILQLRLLHQRQQLIILVSPLRWPGVSMRTCYVSQSKSQDHASKSCLNKKKSLWFHVYLWIRRGRGRNVSRSTKRSD